MNNIEELKEYVKSMVNEKRYKHSLLVAEQSKKLGEIYNEDIEDLYFAGLMHDIAKDIPYEESLKYLDVKDMEKNIIHAPVGAILLREKYNINDNIYNAVKYHTIGNKNMNTFAKIIYIADKIGRENLNEARQKVKELAYDKKLDEAILSFLEYEKTTLIERNLKQQDDTIELIDYLKESIK